MEQTLFETNITAAVEALREQAGNRWRVPAALLSRTMEYYTEQAPLIREHLNAGASDFWELDTETENVLLEDYARALFGVFDFRASREQMEKLRALRSGWAYNVDKYGLYYAVLGGYWGICRGLDEYDRITAAPEDYRGPEFQEFAQQAYITNGPYYHSDARAVSYLIRTGEFDAARFAGVSGPAEVNAFLDRCKLFAAATDYATYYGICKYCLRATREELAAIPAPVDAFGFVKFQQEAEQEAEQAAARAQQFAEQEAARVRKSLGRIAENLAEVVDAPTVEATTEAIEQAREENQNPPRDIVRVPETFAGVLSRDVYASKYGETVRNENDILPIQSFISAYMEKHPDETGTTTPLYVEKAIEGVNMLQRVENVKPAGGWYAYKTTITEFATLCGYETPTGEQTRAVFLALMVLNGLYLAVWRPRGLAAVKILNVREIGLTGDIRGKIIIEVSTEAIKGAEKVIYKDGKKIIKRAAPQLLAWKDFERMRREAKGYAENHFRYQIIGKGHKTENALLNEIFGYDNALNEAQEQGADAETLNKLRRHQQQNKPRDKKRLLKMFEREQAAGFLTFRKYTNAKGETVYSWKRTDTEKQEPDEQEQPTQE